MPLTEIDIQGAWFSGQFGSIFSTQEGNTIRILDFGDWNHAPGPDFLNVLISIDDKIKRGDLELDPTPEDWEKHGHALNPHFRNVILHVSVTQKSQKICFIKNDQNKLIPEIILSPDGNSPEIELSSLPLCSTNPGLCSPYFAKLSTIKLKEILLTASRKRWEIKRRQFLITQTYQGKQQATYEALAETLGYHANRRPLRQLAQHISLKYFPKNPEAVFLATAGFLPADPPKHLSLPYYNYFQSLWNNWWSLRHLYELSPQRQLHWQTFGCRPSNHPQRRIIALCQIGSQLRQLTTLTQFPTKNYKTILKFLISQSHPWWDFHSTIFGKEFSSSQKLIGIHRANDFFTNHLLPAENSSQAWQLYLSLPASPESNKIHKTCCRMLALREDSKNFLSKTIYQQALLQLSTDFCAKFPCLTCPMPKLLKQHLTTH